MRLGQGAALPQALESVMPPWEWFSLARLGGRFALGAGRRLGSAFASGSSGRHTRAFVLAQQLTGATIRGVDEFAPRIGAGGVATSRPVPSFTSPSLLTS